MNNFATTIVARNYLPLARTLCESFLEHHPLGHFFVLLVDEFEGEFDPDTEKFELIRLDALNLPGGDLFLYKYSILELSTAVKPFLMKYLIERYQLESLLYLDPDLYITAPLTDVYKALERSSIILTPHMFSPPPDDGKNPTERDIMLSGVYILGFLAVKNDSEVMAMLDWWSDRLATLCVVDLPNALFVDQRWMDLAPSYFNGVEILRDPSLNVAYWNLHERNMSIDGKSIYVNGTPLVFFHFSGFNPNKLDSLSKHQSRHCVNDSPALRAISEEYAERLLANGYQELSTIPVGFNMISNGISLGKLSQYVIRRAIERGLNVPSPRKDPDGFCRFIMTPSHLFDKRAIAPLIVALEHFRPDVKAHFPQAFEGVRYAESIRDWVRSSGGVEEGIEALFVNYGHLLDRSDVVQRALNLWRKRSDLRQAFPEAFSTADGAAAYAHWIERRGTIEDDFSVGDGERFVGNRSGLLRPLMLFLQDQNLQREFKFIFLESDRARYVNWLYFEACPRAIVSPGDVAWFDGFVESNPTVIAEVTLGFGAWLHANLVGGGTVFDLRQLKDLLKESGVSIAGEFLVRLYTGKAGLNLLAQAEQYFRYSPGLQDRFPMVFQSGEHVDLFTTLLVSAIENGVRGLEGLHSFGSREDMPNSWIERMKSTLGVGMRRDSYPPGQNSVDIREFERFLIGGLSKLRSNRVGVNLVGYFHSPTGMGESARSMSRTLLAGHVLREEIPLPTTSLGPWIRVEDLEQGKLLKSYDVANRINMIVANGDDFPHVRSRLPYAFWKGRKNIGFWVWETECLPQSHSDSQGLDEIWTPSEYSARAIRKAVKIPVKVIPHVLDFDEIDAAIADRLRFGISDDQIAYGFFFDCKSVVERKNPYGLINAFRMAFGSGNKEVVLVLKAASAELAPVEHEQLKHAAQDLNVIWITEHLSRDDTLNLMKSLDVYVSLHRSEGFGLTCAEAMASGLPVVASNYSGNCEFMHEDNSFLIPVRVITTDRAFGPYPTGTRWGDPDLEAAAEAMRLLQQKARRSDLGGAGQKFVREQLNLEKIGSMCSAFLNTSTSVDG